MASNQKDVSATGVLKIIVNLISQDQAANTSRIQVIGQMINTGTVASYHSTSDIGRSINGTVYYNASHFSFNIGAGATFTFINETFTVAHRADGTLSVSFTVSYGATGTSTFGDNKSVGVSATITRIPKRPSPPHTPNYSNVTSSSLTVTWGASDDNGGKSIQYYLIRQSLNSNFSSYTDKQVNGTAVNLTGLTPGQTYWHRIFAYNGAADGGGYSAYSQNHAVMPSVPGSSAAPILSSVTSNSLTVSWKASTDTTVDYYVLSYWPNVSGSGTPTTVQVYGISTDITGLTPGNGYRFSVQAHNSVGLSIPSSPITITLTSKPTAPSKPLFTNKLPISVTVSWSAPANNGGTAITSYNLRMYQGVDTSGSYTDTSVKSTSAKVTGLTPGSSYTFEITAQNGSDDNGGLSDPSPTATYQALAGVKIRANGIWVTAVPYIRHNNKWVLAIPYVRSSGVWTLTD